MTTRRYRRKQNSEGDLIKLITLAVVLLILAGYQLIYALIAVVFLAVIFILGYVFWKKKNGRQSRDHNISSKNINNYTKTVLKPNTAINSYQPQGVDLESEDK